MGEIIFNCFWALFFLVFIYQANTIESIGDTDPVGPGGFPLLIAILGLILIVCVLAQTLKNALKNLRNSDENSKTFVPLLSYPAIFCLVALTVYTLCLDIFGFTVSTFGLLFSLVLLCGLNSLPKSLLTGFAGTTVFIVLFGRMLNVTLPRGMDLLKELSFYLY